MFGQPRQTVDGLSEHKKAAPGGAAGVVRTGGSEGMAAKRRKEHGTTTEGTECTEAELAVFCCWLAVDGCLAKRRRKRRKWCSGRICALCLLPSDF